MHKLDHLYGLILTFGLALIIEGLFRNYYGSSGQPYQVPDALQGGRNLGFMFLPNYRAWVIAFSLVVCFATWFAIERTRLGSYLRAATENPTLVRAFGINVPRMVTLTYGFGVGLAALAGVMAAPIYNVSPQMGSDLIIVVFAVVVIGGMGSIMGAILTGFALGIVEGLTKVFFPEASNTVIFVIMVIVLLDPAGRPVRPERVMASAAEAPVMRLHRETAWSQAVAARWSWSAFLRRGAVCALSGVSHEGAVLCAVRLRLQSSDRLCRAGFVRPRALFRLGELSVPPMPPSPGACRPSLRSSSARRPPRVLGVVAGGIAIRRQGIYFAMITLALAQMMYFVALRVKFTGGEDGIQAVPRGRLFGLFDLNDEMTMYAFVLVVVLAGFFLIYRVINSPFGEVLKAIRENEQRAISLGYNTDRYKLVAFVLSATLAGLAGSVKALVFQLASLTDVHWTMSGEVVLMTLVGGLGTIFGPVVGAFLIVAMENYLAPFGQWVLVIQGVDLRRLRAGVPARHRR